ncbi:adenylate/guanylate cyclase domain-containing protein [Reyranella sp.]|uniref:adenylate/guanylate cyclase domain-containing protein n=1 Tax=Reyranella sp. TaxID=1929291 RepID=UPI003BABEDF0
MGIRRKVGLFLFVVMATVSLAAMVVASLAMYRLVSEKQANEIERLEASLSERFAVFETMLRSQHQRIVAHMETVLPQIAAELDRLGQAPQDLSVAELDALTRKFGVQHIYFIDRAHKVFQTNLPGDMNLVFPESPFTRFLDSVYDAGKVMNDGIDLSSLTGTLRTYSYFGPKGKDYIIETSTDVRESLAQGNFGWMSTFFFRDLFSDAVRSNPYVKEVDLFLVTPAGTWSLLHVGKKLDPALSERVTKTRRETLSSDGGHLLTVYSGEETKSATDPGYPVTSKFVIRQITYDVGLARQAVVQVFLSSLLVLALMLPVVFWIASRLLQHQLLDPLFNLRKEAGAIAQGDLDQAIANTDRTDEIGQLANSFATMRDAVRSTITNLRQTNLSIERFVPHAFLATVGKPSIVDVQLGDNKRKNMTVLFSDIRNFTTLSEGMTPDENFAFINAYLERMGPVIRDHNGFIDKYIGDAIMALFESADDALAAGLDMLATLDAFNAERVAAGQAPLGIGIGLNTGSLMMGTIGEKHRMDGTVISDAVNLASRVEGLTKTYGVGLLVTQDTVDQLSDPQAWDLRPIDVVVVKGKTRPVTVYEVFQHDPAGLREVKKRTRGMLEAGVEALSRNDIPAARRLFEQCQGAAPGDVATTNLMQKCA